MTTPALQPYALGKVVEGQRELTEGLLAAYPDELDPVTAAAMTGALVGALVATIASLFQRAGAAPMEDAAAERMQADMERTVRTALSGFGDLGRG
jgi:hypothetical protein